MVERGDVELPDQRAPDPRRILEELPIGVLIMGADGTVIWTSERAARMVGSNPDDVQGTNVMHLLPPEDLGDAGEILDFAIDYDDDIMGPVSMRYL
ncbi:MAG: PAS domain-containing protein, partial [Acidimicrobiia bacterium]|nr:PAS domain-containing protein [Acidimicrobiia bacterium]